MGPREFLSQPQVRLAGPLDCALRLNSRLVELVGAGVDDLRIGVLGSGARGLLAEYAHRPDDGSRVVAVCDTNPDTLAKCRETYGADIFTTDKIAELFSQNLDAVFILTPDFLHEEQAIAALNRGLAVYLEKPMAITTEGCDRILEAAAKSDGRVYLGHNMRHMRFVLKMKELIDSGAIGEVKTAWCRHFVGHGGDFFFKDWHSLRANVTGLLIQKAAHDIDVLHWLCGGYSKRVNAMGTLAVYGQPVQRQQGPLPRSELARRDIWPPLSHTQLSPEIDVEDLSMMQMELDNGVLAAYQQCNFTPDYWRSYTIIGTEGRIENFGDTQPGAVIKLWNRRVGSYHPEADETYAVGADDSAHGGSDERIVAEFLGFVRRDVTPSTSPLAARNAVAAGYAASQSLRNGGVPVDIPPVPKALVDYFG